MPTLHIVTNVPRSSLPADFLHQASVMFQATIGKPMEYISVVVVPDQLVSFADTADPCAIVNVTSIGKLGVEENKAIAKAIFDFIKEKLNIDGKRAYVVFNDKPRHEIGYNGTTFAK